MLWNSWKVENCRGPAWVKRSWPTDVRLRQARRGRRNRPSERSPVGVNNVPPILLFLRLSLAFSALLRRIGPGAVRAPRPAPTPDRPCGHRSSQRDAPEGPARRERPRAFRWQRQDHPVQDGRSNSARFLHARRDRPPRCHAADARCGYRGPVVPVLVSSWENSSQSCGKRRKKPSPASEPYVSGAPLNAQSERADWISVTGR